MQRKFRVAIVQFAPAIGRVEENVGKANELCSKIQPDSVDLVCLPEMIFTGYDFPNAEAITPYLEEPQKGPTSQFCKSLARRLRCHVAAGYPEVLKPEERGTREDGSAIVGANSAAIYDHQGKFLGGYRKGHLYETDRTWAIEGDNFKSWKLTALPDEVQTLSIGICMDLNPRPPTLWTLKDGPYEMANYCRSTEGKPRTNILLLLNAWLDSKEVTDSKWDLQTLNYWIARLRPLWDTEHESNSRSSEAEGKETIVVICNRCGVDNADTLFAGTSAVLRLREGTGDPEVVGVMGRREESVKIFNV
ncbi:hydrolase [Fomitiporia mediterranea MF3/22]|uniref:hydrolase n=1 Tax=Fomitiporia mediterranea (strain MF3/22) TaxID=694068 RepID=UPI0004407EA0|nr:hydrolase [Fomitiporia mediterranea MF3/22]EJC98131.1 hydrolase [Fomitiporia mediterranea MF3/22]